MEIVKRLEGSEPEEVEFNFEEQNVEKDKKNKKSIILIVISIISIGILSYFGFKFFNTEKVQKTEIPSITPDTTKKESNELAIVIKKEAIKKPTIITEPKQEIKPKIELPLPIKKINKPIAKVVTYTEELAKEMKPVKTTKVIPKKPIVEKPIPKKIIIQKVVIKKEVPKIIRKKVRRVTIKRGDTLASIAQKYYGNPMEFQRIIRANKNIKSAKTNIKLGQEIIVPYMPKGKQKRFVIVKNGYSLAYISKKFYGNIQEVQRIVDANHNIKNKNSTIKIGQKIYVPR